VDFSRALCTTCVAVFCALVRTCVHQLDEKAQELHQVQKNVVELRCEVDAERSKWLADKSQFQADLDEALKDRDEERQKAAQLNAEVDCAPASHVTVFGRRSAILLAVWPAYT